MSRHSESIKLLTAALVNVQKDLEGAKKDSTNPFFKSKYADLESTWEACRALLAKEGLAVIQTTEFHDIAGICLVTTLSHTSGEWIRGVLPIFPKVVDPQGIGAAITYSRRYALAAIIGVVQTDDDGETAMGRPPEQPKSLDEAKSKPAAKLPKATSAKSTTTGDCQHNFMVSKYNAAELYCTKCKLKKARDDSFDNFGSGK